MTPCVIRHASGLRGALCLPGDKSIAHRAVILGALARGITTITNFPTNKDCLATVKVFTCLGIPIRVGSARNSSVVLKVAGRGLRGIAKPKGALYAGESGTTFRLLLGVLAAQGFTSVLTAAVSLSKRPMLRVTGPLRLMGATIQARSKPGNLRSEEYPPIKIFGGKLQGIVYKMPVASAQVKSALLLAGLYAQGKTRVVEPVASRDHTERMLKLFKARIAISKKAITVMGQNELVSPGSLYVPGDISSASFFMVAAVLLPHARLVIKNVSLNPTRIGVIRVLRRMGADIRFSKKAGDALAQYEPVGDVVVKSSVLKSTKVAKHEIPSLIDELPVLMVAASLACGRTLFEGVGELRVKETDRIMSMCENLKRMGADIKAVKVGSSEQIVVQGVKELHGARVRSFGDHRTAMSMVVAGFAAQGHTRIDDVSCIKKSFPDFLKIINRLKYVI